MTNFFIIAYVCGALWFFLSALQEISRENYKCLEYYGYEKYSGPYRLGVSALVGVFWPVLFIRSIMR